MSIVSFLSCLYFLLTIVLMFKRNTLGNTYMGFGALTFVFVMAYPSIPKIPPQFQSLGIFLVFSLMIILFGLTFGIIIILCKKSNKVSRITAVISSTLLIILLFNSKGYLTYMYIPVLLYMLQDYTNKMMEKATNKSFVLNK
ncbi:hypothetical protein [Romboutsia sp.]|uniref:hypothetical protein n=1 Tax=Romboutsia sp. TaxID=1965302 RepID=UPI003F3CB06A